MERLTERRPTHPGYGNASAVMAAALLALSCGDGDTAPVEFAFDVAAAQAGLAAMNVTLDDPRWTNFTALKNKFLLSGASPQLPIPAGRSTAALVPVIPPEYIGSTLTYDGVFREYRVDPARAGAPTDGVTFVLYEVDPVNSEPVLETESGRVDILDHGAEQPGFSILIQAFAGQERFAAYTASFELDQTALGRTTSSAFDHLGLYIDALVGDEDEGTIIRALTGTADGIDITDIELSLSDGSFLLSGSVAVDD